MSIRRSSQYEERFSSSKNGEYYSKQKQSAFLFKSLKIIFFYKFARCNSELLVNRKRVEVKKNKKAVLSQGKRAMPL